MRKLFTTLLLALSLTITASAGEIPNNLTAAPQPSPVPASTYEEGAETAGNSERTALNEDLVTEYLTALLRNVINLF